MSSATGNGQIDKSKGLEKRKVSGQTNISQFFYVAQIHGLRLVICVT